MSSDPSGIDYVAVLADMKAKRARLDAGIAAIEAMLKLPGGATTPSPQSPAAVEIVSGMFSGLSIPDAAKKFLAVRKHQATTPQIVEGLRQGGQRNAASRSFPNTVASVLARVDANAAGIVHVGRGTWALAEWAPAKSRKSLLKNDGEKDESAAQ